MYQPMLEDEESALPSTSLSSKEANGFTGVVGHIPWQAANVRSGHANADLFNYLNEAREQTSDCVKGVLRTLCCCLLPVFGGCYLLGKQVLVKEGEWGFAMNNGNPLILLPGRHLLSSPLNSLVGVRSQGDDRIEEGPVSIIRIPEGCVGFAMAGSEPEILLPGQHVRKDAAFKFDRFYSLSQELITYGPIKLFIVKSGTVRVCYHGGRVCIYKVRNCHLLSLTALLTLLTRLNLLTLLIGRSLHRQQWNL
jgi:hypothetical protein